MKSIVPHCVWVVDDDPSVLQAVGRLLQSDGFETAKFSDPGDFLTAAAETPCRVAVLDVAMPQIDGLQVQATLRRTSPKTRVVFLSGQGNASVRETALQNGAVAFLDKPCDDEEFLRAVRGAMDGQEQPGPPDAETAGTG